MLLAFLEAKMSSKKPFGWILGRFGKVGGRFGEALRGNFKGFGAECWKGWEELGRIGDSWTKSWGKLRQAKKSMADHTFVHSCAFRSPARSGLIPQGKRPPTTGVNFWGKNLKRPKNREDSSDFDDFWTELIALTWAIISNFFFLCIGGPPSPQISKISEKFSPITYGS